MDDDYLERDGYNRRKPRSEKLLMTAVLIAAVVTGGSLAYLNKRQETNVARSGKSNMLDARAEHLRMLEDTKRNLTALTDYVTRQVEQARSADQAIAELEAKQRKLKPLVKTDIQIVNALFEAQEERARKWRWLEWFLSFLMGIFSSIISSFLWERYRHLLPWSARQ